MKNRILAAIAKDGILMVKKNTRMASIARGMSEIKLKEEWGSWQIFVRREK